MNDSPARATNPSRRETRPAGDRGRSPFTVAVASGKGGTGKTMVATGLAAMASADWDVVLVDCDVEAPDDHLFFESDDSRTERVTVPIARVDTDRCTACGACRNACAYGAVRILGSSATVYEDMCHGCGLCIAVCRNGAMKETDRSVGQVVSGKVAGTDGSGGLWLATGMLDVGEVKAPSVIQRARASSADNRADLVILDAPPGVSCTAVASVKGADLLLLVTEPTPFGLHDLELAYRLGTQMGIPMAVVVNRDDENGDRVDRLVAEWGVPIVARVPFDRAVASAYSDGRIPSKEVDTVEQALRSVLTFIEPHLADFQRPNQEVV